MFITPYFGGCKYTNNFLFINNNIEFQRLGLLITPYLLHNTACLLLTRHITSHRCTEISKYTPLT